MSILSKILRKTGYPDNLLGDEPMPVHGVEIRQGKNGPSYRWQSKEYRDDYAPKFQPKKIIETKG